MMKAYTIHRKFSRFSRMAVTLALCLFLALGGVFPDKGYGITVKEEEDLSREFLKVLSKRYEIIKDPLIVDYVKRIGNRIVSFLPTQPFSYHFYVIREDVYNAFATPAGHIFINSGLIVAMETEEELAGILAHEIAHVACRHISQKIDRSKKIQLATLAGVVAGAFLGIGGSGTAASAVTAGSVAAGESAALAYSREDETQADQLGLALLEKAGYGADGLLSMLRKIRGKQWFGSDQIPSYLSTHPASEERMGYIDTWIENHSTDSKTSGSRMFRQAHTRLVGVYAEEDFALRYFKAAVAENPKNPDARYGYGLVLARGGKHQEAIDQFRSALEFKAFDPYILKDIGRLYYIEGRYAEAMGVLDGARSIADSDPELLFYLGRTQIALGQLETAARTLEAVVEKTPDYDQAYYFLGDAYGKMERFGDAHYNLGMYYRYRHDMKNAAFHLRKALTYLTDPARIEAVEALLKTAQKDSSERERKEGPRVRRR